MPWVEKEQKRQRGRFPANQAALPFLVFADPLADLRLVSLRKDVDVGLEGAGFDHGFVSGGHRQDVRSAGRSFRRFKDGSLKARQHSGSHHEH